MATKYNFEAERPEDYVIRQTDRQEDDQWLQTVNRPGPYPGPWRDHAQISNRIELPPRVIRLMLQSGSAVERDARSMTWVLSFPQAEPLRPGTIVHWDNLTIDNMGSQDWIEVGLSGIRTTALNTNSNEIYTFIAGGNFSADSLAKFVQFGSTTPVCSTLLELNILNGGRVTLHNRNLLQLWDGDTDLRTSLVFIEPGARIY